MLCGKRYEVMLFFWGAAIAQTELLFKGKRDSENDQPTTEHLKGMTRLIAKSPFVTIPAAYISLVLMFYPPPALNQGNYATRFVVVRLLDKFIPSTYPEKDKLYDGLGVAILVVGLVFSSPRSIGRRILTNQRVQRLGKMFFGTILVQSMVLNGGGYLVPHVFWAWLDSVVKSDPNTTGFVRYVSATRKRQQTAGLVVGCLLNVPAAVFLGELFVKTVVRWCMVAVLLIESVVCRPENTERPTARHKMVVKEM